MLAVLLAAVALTPACGDAHTGSGVDAQPRGSGQGDGSRETGAPAAGATSGAEGKRGATDSASELPCGDGDACAGAVDAGVLEEVDCAGGSDCASGAADDQDAGSPAGGDACSVDNGGCGDPQVYRCVNHPSGPPSCVGPDGCIKGDLCESSCLRGIDGFDSQGPFEFSTESIDQVSVWIPRVPAGCRLPVVQLSVGTGASCDFYEPSIERLASHGFLTACDRSNVSSWGDVAFETFTAVLEAYPDLAAKRFGSTGHSTGGQAALVALQYAEDAWAAEGVYAALAMQPSSGFGAQPPEGAWAAVYGKIRSPVFMFSGQGTDGLVSQRWVQDGFDALADDVEAYHWSKEGSSHFEPNADNLQIAVPWFRWKLLDDQDACRAFKRVRETDATWLQAAVQNEQPCL